jgi:hypothetical protein
MVAAGILLGERDHGSCLVHCCNRRKAQKSYDDSVKFAMQHPPGFESANDLGPLK